MDTAIRVQILERLIAFHIALIPLEKVWIQLSSLQLWVNNRAAGFFSLGVIYCWGVSYYLYKGYSIKKKNFFEKRITVSFCSFFSEFSSINVNSVVFRIVLKKKKYFFLTEIFLLASFKMAANQTECCRLKQRSVIKYLVADKYKQCEI